MGFRLILSFLFITELLSDQNFIFKMMERELNRSMEKLKMESMETPYFIAYRVEDAYIFHAEAAYGVLLKSDLKRSRVGSVELRVGSCDLDNVIHGEDYIYSISLPIDDIEESFLHQLWQVTDRAYKSALKSLFNKRSQIIKEVKKEKILDYSKAVPQEYVEPKLKVEFDRNKCEKIIIEVSAIFKSYPEILNSKATIQLAFKEKYLLNSEGTRLKTNYKHSYVHIYAKTRAKETDIPIDNFIFCEGEDFGDLPKLEELKFKTKKMIDELLVLRNSKKMESYSGPAIFEKECSCIFFSIAFTPYVLADRKKSDEGLLIFEDKLNQRVLPEFISIVCDPTIKEYKGQKVYGWYKFDDEGVPAERVLVVKDGVLKNMLTTRTPTKHFRQSNAHARLSSILSSPKPMVSNFIVEPSRTFSFEALKKMLIERCRKQNKKYGLIFKKMYSGGTPILISKVYLDGKEEIVHGVTGVKYSIATLEKIIACSNRFTVYNRGFEAAPYSYICPDILVDDVELTLFQGKPQRAPLLQAP